MIVVKLMGGLGNQMFQYAFGKYLSEKHRTELKFDLDFLLDRTWDTPHFVFREYDLDIFTLEVPRATREEISRLRDRSGSLLADKILQKLAGSKKTYIKEPHFEVSSACLNAPADCYVEGYWQSPKYFPETQGKPLFTFRNDLSAAAAKLLEAIAAVPSVCVNVRRGDFVTNPVHGTMGTDYYNRAEKLLNKRFPDLQYFVFSDDMEWCEANLRFERPVTFVSHAYAGAKFQDYLRLMAACDHFIIPNSSFAWWAAWLAENPEKTVIAPKKWFADEAVNSTDLIPESWIRL